MIQHVYASFNRALANLWSSTAPSVQIVYGHPVPPATLPAECLRIYWLEYGGGTERTNEQHSLIQLDLFGPSLFNLLARASAIEEGLSLVGSGQARLGVYDFAVGLPFDGQALDKEGTDYNLLDEAGNTLVVNTTSPILGEMSLQGLESSWQTVPDPDPRIFHIARTVEATWIKYQ